MQLCQERVDGSNCQKFAAARNAGFWDGLCSFASYCVVLRCSAPFETALAFTAATWCGIDAVRQGASGRSLSRNRPEYLGMSATLCAKSVRSSEREPDAEDSDKLSFGPAPSRERPFQERGLPRCHPGRSAQSLATAATASENEGTSPAPAKAMPSTNRAYSSG